MTEPKKQLAEQLSIDQIKQYLKKNYPELQQSVKKITEEELRMKYRQLRQADKQNQVFYNQDSEDVNNFISINQSEHCKFQDDYSCKSKISRKDRFRSQNNINQKQDLPTSNEIRELLMKNIPEMQYEIKIINEQDLYDLYDYFKRSSQPQQKSKNPEKIQMMTAILKQIPSMKDKLCNCTQIQIKKIYESLKQIRTHPYSTMDNKKTKRSEIQNNLGVSTNNLSNYRKNQQIQIQLQTQASKKTKQRNRIYDSDRYLQQELEPNKKKSQKNLNGSKPQKAQYSFANNRYLGGQELQIPFIRKQKQKEKEKIKTKMWQMQHGQGQNVRARTYVMIHTQYQGQQPRKRMKGQANVAKCNCSCCKNNTFVNIFKQIIQEIQSKKR